MGSVNDQLSKDEKNYLRAACRFSLKSNANLGIRDVPKEHKKILSVYSNIISRGFPTYNSLYVERMLGQLYGKHFGFQDLRNEKEFNFQLDNELKDDLLNASTLIEPRCNSISKSVDEFMGSKPAKAFYDSLPLHIKQFTQPERNFSDGILLEDPDGRFYRRQVDFAIETPTGVKWIIEIDGKQHHELAQQEIDKIRDEALYDSGWKVERAGTSQAHFQSDAFRSLRKDLDKDQTIRRAKKNVENPLWESNTGFDALHLALSPIAIGRVQKAICEAAISGNLNLQDKELHILCYERDVAYSLPAIEDLFHWLNKLYELAGIPFNNPRIDLKIIGSAKFSKNENLINDIALNYINSQAYIKEEQVGDVEFDLVVDCSVLEKSGLRSMTIQENSLKERGVFLELRSEFNTTLVASIEGVEPIEYANTDKETLTFFLRQIFRKNDFRPKQEDIISRTLSGKDTVGLLPTGSGKSLCYQLSTLLQPGISIIIEPLKALMVDQHRNMKNALIESCVYINSDIDAAKREVIERRWARSEYQYIWISPERLQIQEFRNYLQRLSHKMPVIYAVIDEAHCVSEWGHDFRTSYLMMRKTILKYCEHEGRKPIFYALTATASETVLEDIVNELVPNREENPIIRPFTFDRKELNFRILRCNSSEKFDHFTEAIGEICSTLGINTDELFEPNGKDTKSGLVFCPHVNNTDYSISQVSSKISSYYDFSEIVEQRVPQCNNCGEELVERTGLYGNFLGCPNYPRCDYTEQITDGEIRYYDRLHMFGGKHVEGFDAGAWDEYKIKAQEEFVEDKVPLMVSTKAFGMGIDKPNIRYTIHYNIPSSLEAFYQEAGRAGRDGDEAVNVIIFSDDSRKDARDRLSTNRSASEVRNMPQIAREQEGDIHRMLFFQTLSFQGFEKELDAVREILNYSLAEAFLELEVGKTTNVTITTYKGNKTEKAIYRLYLIGLVVDYTIEFSKPRVYKVEIQKHPEKKYSNVLLDYMSIHGIPKQNKLDLLKHTENEDIFYEYVQNRDYNHFVTKCCVILLEYIYATIEPQRRRALLNLVNALDSGDPDSFRNKILYHLNPDEELNQFFNKFPDKNTLEDLVRIFEKADNEESRNKLLGVTLRFLESYPNNMGLLIISTGLRLSLPNEDPKLAQDDFDTALSILSNTRDNEEPVKILKILVGYLLNAAYYYPSTVNKIVKQSSEFVENSDFDTWLYYQNSSEAIKEYAAVKLTDEISDKTEKLIEKIKA